MDLLLVWQEINVHLEARPTMLRDAAVIFLSGIKGWFTTPVPPLITTTFRGAHLIWSTLENGPCVVREEWSWDITCVVIHFICLFIYFCILFIHLFIIYLFIKKKKEWWQ